MPNWKKIIVSGSDASLNTLTVLNGITGSLYGTASYAIAASSTVNAQDILIYVKNSSGTQINKGKVVQIAGAVGDNPLIATASYTSDNNSANTLGITNESIAHDSFGYVMTEGRLVGIDTSTFTAGQLIYLGATGSIIGTAPLAPLHAVRLGQVLRSQLNNGSIYIRVDNGFELGELHDVLDNTTTGSYGDLLVKSGSIWINSKQLTGSYAITGSLTATSFTGSLLGTASYATQALSASFAPSTPAFPFTGSAIVSGSLTVTGSLNITGSSTITNGALILSSSAISTYVLRTAGDSVAMLDNYGLAGRSYLRIGTNGIFIHNAGGDPTIGCAIGMNLNSSATIYSSATSHIFYGGTNKQVSIGTAAVPTAKLHIAAGAAAATSAPIKLTAGTNMTTPEAGAIEFDGNSLFFTTGSTRSTLLTSINPTSSTNINVQGLTIGKGRTGSLDNVYIHTASVSPNVTGTRNVGIGGATTGVTSGNYNIGVGFGAGVSATTATHNAFFGGFAGYLSNGNYNTFVGMEANYKAAGNYNVAVGFDCMFENTGTRNTGVGPQAGMYVATGNDNTYFGYNAGRYIADGVTNSGISSASVFLGVDSRPLASSQTNQIVIGYQAIGLGSNTVVIGNNSITTTALKGNTQVSGSLNVSGSTTIRGNTIITGSLLVSGSVRLNGNAGVNITGNTVITGSLLLSGSSLVAGITPIPLAGTIQDGVTSVLGSLNDWNSNFYQGTVLYSETAASTITFGQLCYRTQNETWDLADATAANSAAAYNMLGICVKSSTATNPTSILINGFVETAAYATIVKSGEPLYMATTPGSMTKTAPTTSGNAVRLIGNTFWDSNTNTKIIIHFNPDRSWIELT